MLALESVRLLKLYYWSIVEHVRSDDGEQVWRGASVMLQQFSTETEWLELIEEFGGVQQGDSRSHVEIPEVAESGRAQLHALTFWEARYGTPSAKMQTVGTLWVRVHFAGA